MINELSDHQGSFFVNVYYPIANSSMLIEYFTLIFSSEFFRGKSNHLING